MTELGIDTKSTAFLVLHVGVKGVDSLEPSEKNKILSNLPKAIKAARIAHIPVIYEVIQSSAEGSTKKPDAGHAKEPGAAKKKEIDSDTEFYDEMRPESGDVVVPSKGRTFLGSDLEIALRSKKISTLVLTGISPLGIVYRTEQGASRQGYKVIVLGDCCSDRDPIASETVIKRILPVTSTVCSTNDFIAAIA